jgi:hypothetical protein
MDQKGRRQMTERQIKAFEVERLEDLLRKSVDVYGWLQMAPQRWTAANAEMHARELVKELKGVLASMRA